MPYHKKCGLTLITKKINDIASSLTYYYRSMDNYWTLDPICTVPRDIAF